MEKRSPARACVPVCGCAHFGADCNTSHGSSATQMSTERKHKHKQEGERLKCGAPRLHIAEKVHPRSHQQAVRFPAGVPNTAAPPPFNSVQLFFATRLTNWHICFKSKMLFLDSFLNKLANKQTNSELIKAVRVLIVYAELNECCAFTKNWVKHTQNNTLYTHHKE